MTFTPIIASTGISGWRFLENTFQKQTQAFEKAPDLQREKSYFQENISDITSAKDLVSDRRLLKVALEAFGLGDDINNKFFIQKILEEGVKDEKSLANRLSDTRYKDFAKAFSFEDGQVPSSQRIGFSNLILSKFVDQRFEIAVGEQDQTMRLALNLKRELPDILTSDASEETKIFQILGNPPLREAFQTALGLPKSFSQIDIDQQLSVVKEKYQQKFDVSSLDELLDPEKIDKIIVNYLARSQISQGALYAPGSTALTLLSNMRMPQSFI